MKLPRMRCGRCGHEWIPRRDRPPNVCSACKSPYWNKPKVRPATRGWAKVIERDIQAAVEQSHRWRREATAGSETLAELSDALVPLRRGKMGRRSAELERRLERCLTEA
jgi:hypothetical protein